MAWFKMHVTVEEIFESDKSLEELSQLTENQIFDAAFDSSGGFHQASKNVQEGTWVDFKFIGIQEGYN
jgi:hypothetical protein